MMNGIRAVGFDLFNTLVTVEPTALLEAVDRLVASLALDGLVVDKEQFREAHRRAAIELMKKAHATGRETHNRYWISTALAELGYRVKPDDRRIASAVDAYFDVYVHHAARIPGTREMLDSISCRFRVGLLSNFTHAPAAVELMERLEDIASRILRFSRN
ncbi:MAG: hypothetical protein JRI89_17830 [Deltaproteobacteria bacterium]|nr:hypothetical protein [Deltaproteobacteria bacterium]